MQTLARPPKRRVAPGARIAPGRRRRAILFRRELASLVVVAGPIVASQLGGIAMNTTDTLMVGPLGATALAAVGLGNALFMAAVMVCTGVVLGMGPLVSQAYGAGDREECRRILVQGLWIAGLLTVPMTALCLAGEPVARALGQSPEVAELAGGYLRALAPGVLPMLLFMSFRQFLEGMGATRPPMVMTFLGLGVNVLGNLAFIYGVDGMVPAMGAVGSGWATTAVRWAMLVAMLAYLAWHPALHPFRGVRRRPDGARVRRIVAIGAPIGTQLAAEVGLFSLAAVMMGWMGPLQQAAHQVTINLAATTFMVALGTALAGSIRVGQHVGARNPRAVHRAVLATYLLSVVFMGACAVAFLAAPEGWIALYTSDPEILRTGAGLLVMAAAFQVFDGAQAAGLCVLRGAADTRIPMLFTIVGYWLVGAPAAYLLGFHTPLAGQGVWAGLVVALAAVAVLLAWRVRRVLWARPLAPRTRTA